MINIAENVWRYRTTVKCLKRVDFPKFLKEVSCEMGIQLRLKIYKFTWFHKEEVVSFEAISKNKEVIEMFEKIVNAVYRKVRIN